MGFSLADGLLTLDSIQYLDRYSAISGQGSLKVASWSSAEGWIRLQDREGSERYALTVSRGQDGPALLLDFDRTPLERAGELAVRGTSPAACAFRGSLRDPVLGLRLQLADGRLNADPLAVELSATYQDHRFDMENLTLSLLRHRLTEGRGHWDMAVGDFAFSSRYAAELLGMPARMTLELAGTTTPAASSTSPGPPAGLRERELDALLRLTGIQVERREYPDWLVKLQARGGELRLDGGPQTAIHASLAKSGRFSLGLQAPLPVQGQIDGQLVRDRIEARFEVTALDMRVLNTLLAPSTHIIEFTEGTGAGALRIAGMLTDPDWFGTIQVRDAAMRFQLTPEPVKPINGRLEFNEKTFSLPRVASQAGRAWLEAEGTFILDHWIPRSFELAFYVERYPGPTSRRPSRRSRWTATRPGRCACAVTRWTPEWKAVSRPTSAASPWFARSGGAGPARQEGAVHRPEDRRGPQRGVLLARADLPGGAHLRQAGEQIALALDGETNTVSLSGDVRSAAGRFSTSTGVST